MIDTFQLGEPALLKLGLGLRPFTMKRLGAIVVLAGRNGAGKSRILTALHSTVADVAAIKASPPQRTTIGHTSLTGDPQLIADLQVDADHGFNVVQEDWLHALEPLGLSAKSDVPKVLALSFGLADLGDPKEPGGGVPPESSLSLDSHTLETIQGVYFDQFWLSHPLNSGSVEETQRATQRWEDLQTNIERLLGQRLTPDSSLRVLTIFGHPIRAAGLSPGQRVLLHIALRLAFVGAALDSVSLVMDEPENHLHPGILIDVMEQIRRASKTVQIWIATHSVPLLAYANAVDRKSIWYVADGTCRRSGKTQSDVLTSLLGDEKRVAQLRHLLSLPSQAALNQFAGECLLDPTVSDQGHDDPQVNQIREIVGQRSQPVRLLDFGAGRGRLLSGIGGDEGGESTRKLLDYVAYERSSEHREECLGIIGDFYDDPESRYLQTPTEVETYSPFDIVVLCNSLHEISPNAWLENFDLVSKALNEDGSLLIVEDQHIGVGELAHEYGFLLLDTEELKVLFNVTEEDERLQRFVVQSKWHERLKGHLIARELILRATRTTLLEAIRSLKCRCKQSVGEMRKRKEPEFDYNRARLHALWSQLFINATLALDDMAAETSLNQ